MTISEKLTLIADNTPKVYDAGFVSGKQAGEEEGYEKGHTAGVADGIEQGKQAEYDAFWDAFQRNGERTDYRNGFGGLDFSGWNDTNFKPKYDMKPTNAGYMFGRTKLTDLKSTLEKQGVVLDTSNSTSVNRMFLHFHTKSIPTLDLRKATDLSECFIYANVEIIDMVILNDTGNQDVSRFFYGTKGIKEIRFEGVIGYLLRFGDCNNLSLESVQSVIDHLKDLTGETAKNLQLHADVVAKLTDAQKDAISAKNWTLVY